VLLDQRGCGSSTPLGGLEENTTDDLVGDIEVLRKELGVDAWVLLGGSWGVTLALAYACAHPTAVRGIILRAVCLFRQQDIDWVYRGGAAPLFPGSWQHFKAQVGATRADDDPLALAHALLTGADASLRARAAAAWHGLGATLSVPLPADGVQVWRGGPGSAWAKLQQADGLGGTAAVAVARMAARQHGAAVPAQPASQRASPSDSPAPAGVMSLGEAQAMLEAHYCFHAGFSLAEVPLLQRVHTLRRARIPIVAIHGRCDLLCPVANAYDLHTALPDMELRIIGGAGHSQYNPGIAHELVCATDAFRVL
jgi:proline iminopeptidase